MSETLTLARARRATHERKVSYQERMATLHDHMYDISDNPQGSDPSLYLSDQELVAFNDFVTLMNNRGWPDAEPIIDMRKSWLPGVPAWTNIRHVGRKALTKTIWYPKIHETKKGIVFGTVNTPGIRPQQRIAVAEDGLLYSERGAELQHSKAFGWGALPDADLLSWAIQPITNLVDYRKYGPDLHKALLSRVDAGHLPR